MADSQSRQPASIVDFEHARNQILPTGLLVRCWTADEDCRIDIAVESGDAAWLILDDFSGKRWAEMPLEVQPKGAGIFRIARAEVPLAVDMVKLRILDAARRRIDTFSYGISLTHASVFPAPDFTPFTEVSDFRDLKTVHWGHPGPAHCPGLVSILELRSSTEGIVVDLLIDDGDRSHTLSYLYFGPKNEAASGEGGAEIRPMYPEPGYPRRCSFVVPLGVVGLELSFHGDHGLLYSCWLGLVKLRFRGLKQPEEPRAIGHAPVTEVTEATPVAPPPVPEPEPDPEPPPAPKRVSIPSEASQIWQDIEARLTASGKKRTPGPDHWPGSIGEDGVALGPTSFHGTRRCLEIQEVSSHADSVTVRLTLEDNGAVHSILVATPGEGHGLHYVKRISPHSRGSVDVVFPASLSDPVLFAQDRFNFSIPNLSARFGVRQRRFEPAALEWKGWYPRVQFRKPVDFRGSHCVVCQLYFTRSALHIVSEVGMERRKVLDRNYVVDIDCWGICSRCLDHVDRKADESVGLEVWLRPEPLAILGSKCLLMILATAIPYSTKGAAVAAWLGPTGIGVLPPFQSMLAVAAISGVFLMSLPWSVFIRPLLEYARALAGKGKLPETPRIVLAGGTALLLLGLLVLDGGLTRMARSPVAMDLFALATAIGIPGGLGLYFIGRWIVALAREREDRELASLVDQSFAVELLNQMLRASNTDDYMKQLKSFLGSGLKATAFRVYLLHPEKNQYEPEILHGVQGSRWDTGPIDLTRPSLRSHAAKHGHPVAWTDVSKIFGDGTEDLPARDQSLVCIPLGHESEVRLLVDVLEMEDTELMHWCASMIQVIRRILDSSLAEALRKESEATGRGVPEL